MSITYTPATNFGAKDSLPTNDPDKVIKGSEFTTEFTAIQTAFGLAAPAASPTFTGTVTIPTADINGGAIDGTTIGSTTPAAGSFTTVSATGNITVGGTVDGRDVAADGTKLDGIEAGADVTDTTNVTAAGALMDSELTNIAAVKALDQGVATTDSPSFAGLTATGSVSLAGASTTADITFGDNDKAIFGAGSDLQIYHNGVNQDKIESTSSFFILEGGNIILRNNGGTEDYAKFFGNGAVELYYDSAKKLATTATGIDVTGTVTADGLTVDGNVDVQSASTASLSLINTDTILSEGQITGAIDFYQSDSTSGGTGISAKIETESVQQTGAGSYYGTAADLNIRVSSGGAANNADLKAATFHHGGDISFYEDTGTTPKFFWDASAESLGIGTTSPSSDLHIYENANTDTTLKIQNPYSGGGSAYASTQLITNAGTAILGLNSSSRSFLAGTQGFYISSPAQMVFAPNATEAMRIDSSGNVVIGATSVSNPNGYGAVLNVEGYAPALVLSEDTGRDYTIGVNGNNLNIFNETTNVLTIADSGNVGIGTASPTFADGSGLEIERASATSTIRLQRTGTSPSSMEIRSGANNGEINVTSNSPLLFATANSEAMRIDSSGNLLVGKSTADVGATAGFEWYDTADVLTLTRSAGNALSVNRLTSDGVIATFRKDGTTVGSIGSTTSDGGSRRFAIGGDGDSGIVFGGAGVLPAGGITTSDNAIDLGSSSYRFDDVYATNGTIQTSDRNEKENIRELLEAEARVAQAAKGLLRAFQWKDSVAEKGDDARIHFGIIAQDLQAAFEAEGLDAGRYAMFIHSTWTDEETGEERSRMGVRYSELLAFIIAAL